LPENVVVCTEEAAVIGRASNKKGFSDAPEKTTLRTQWFAVSATYRVFVFPFMYFPAAHGVHAAPVKK